MTVRRREEVPLALPIVVAKEMNGEWTQPTREGLSGEGSVVERRSKGLEVVLCACVVARSYRQDPLLALVTPTGQPHSQ